MPETTSPSVATTDDPQVTTEEPLDEGERPNRPFGGSGIGRSGVDSFWDEAIDEDEAREMARSGGRDFMENVGFEVRSDWHVSVDPPQHEYQSSP